MCTHACMHHKPSGGRGETMPDAMARGRDIATPSPETIRADLDPPAALGAAGLGKENRIGEEAIDTAKGLEAIRVVGGGRAAPYEIHGIARVHGAVAAGGHGGGAP